MSVRKSGVLLSWAHQGKYGRDQVVFLAFASKLLRAVVGSFGARPQVIVFLSNYHSGAATANRGSLVLGHNASLKGGLMIINMEAVAPAEDVVRVVNILSDKGIECLVARLTDRTVVVAKQWMDDISHHQVSLSRLPYVQEVVQVDDPFKLVSRQGKRQSTLIRVGKVLLRAGQPVVIAGPCSVESESQMILTARAAAHAGAAILRGGAFKPRTSPYDFQGLGMDGLRILRDAGREVGLPVVTEVLSIDHVEQIAQFADMLQVGARNMQNYPLLGALAKIDKPILLKRSPSSTITEWLMAAEYLLLGGNPNVVLCERGVRGFGMETRNSLDIAAIPLAKQLSHLPVIADPSHATGRRDLVPSVAKAALAAGADGLIIEIHPNPERAFSDGAQSLDLHEFAEFMRDLAAPLHLNPVRPHSEFAR